VRRTRGQGPAGSPCGRTSWARAAAAPRTGLPADRDRATRTGLPALPYAPAGRCALRREVRVLTQELTLSRAANEALKRAHSEEVRRGLRAPRRGQDCHEGQADSSSVLAGQCMCSTAWGAHSRGGGPAPRAEGGHTVAGTRTDTLVPIARVSRTAQGPRCRSLLRARAHGRGSARCGSLRTGAGSARGPGARGDARGGGGRGERPHVYCTAGAERRTQLRRRPSL
jgi:hypothetical protein